MILKRSTKTLTLFSELGLDRTSMKSIEKMGFEEASPIQCPNDSIST